MKKIVNGKVYNTETATKVASYSFSNQSDFHYYEETLYRTSKGSYFLTGEGGPLSHYAVSQGNNTTSGSSAITPLSDGEALNWLEEHDFTEEIEKYFPDSIEEA